MSRPLALLAVAALFLTGILAGVLGTHAFYAWQVHRPGGLAAVGLEILANRLDRQLGLTGDQERAVAAILADTRSELAQVRHETVPRVFAIRDRAFERIHGILTPEQQERLERFRARNRRSLERLLGSW
jgi:hypothetical protein